MKSYTVEKRRQDEIHFRKGIQEVDAQNQLQGYRILGQRFPDHIPACNSGEVLRYTVQGTRDHLQGLRAVGGYDFKTCGESHIAQL